MISAPEAASGGRDCKTTLAMLPMEAILAIAAGAALGTAALVVLGTPDRRIDADGVALALAASGLLVQSVERAGVVSKGSRPFVATTAEGRQAMQGSGQQT